MATKKDPNKSTQHIPNVTQSYSRDSIDRFGDDFCQVLLSYLSFDDRFRYECISRQWQRSVYPTLDQLVIEPKLYDALKKSNRGSINMKAFETMVKKCSEVTAIYCWDTMTGPMVEIIMKYCHKLNAICIKFSLKISRKIMDEFFAKFGRQLKSYTYISATEKRNQWYWSGDEFEEFDRMYMKYIRKCVNITDMDVNSGHDLDSQRKFSQLFAGKKGLVFPRLETIAFIGFDDLGDSYGKSESDLKVFIDNHKKTLKEIKMKMAFKYYEEDTINALLDGLPQMKALIALKISGAVIEDDTLANALTQMAANGVQLKSLSLTSDSVNDLIVDTINDHFKRLTRLKLENRPKIESLIGFNRLTHLTLMLYKTIDADETFFANWSQNMPKLSYIKLTFQFDEQLYDKYWQLLSHFRKLKTIILKKQRFQSISKKDMKYPTIDINDVINYWPKIKYFIIEDKNYCVSENYDQKYGSRANSDPESDWETDSDSSDESTDESM